MSDKTLPLSEYTALIFENFPAESETKGAGRNAGKRYRTLECVALNEAGREHRYTLRMARHDTPETVAKAKLEVAERRLVQLQEQDTRNVHDFQGYCDRLTKANTRVDELAQAYRQAMRDAAPAPVDTLKVIDHGMTPRQRELERAAKQERNEARPSGPFLCSILAGAGVCPNTTQWEILADFLEGQSEQPPFFFMGPAWLPVLEDAGAIVRDPSGQPRADGERFRAAYRTFGKSTVKRLVPAKSGAC